MCHRESASCRCDAERLLMFVTPVPLEFTSRMSMVPSESGSPMKAILSPSADATALPSKKSPFARFVT